MKRLSATVRCKALTSYSRLARWGLTVGQCRVSTRLKSTPNSSPMANGKPTSYAPSAMAPGASFFRAVHDLNSMRRAACSEGGAVRDAASRVSTLGSLFFVVLLFHLGPGVFQRHGAVEDQRARFRLRVHAEISQAFELISAFDRRICQRWLQLRLSDYFQRIRIQVHGKLLAFFNLIRIFLAEKLVIDAHFGVDGMRG